MRKRERAEGLTSRLDLGVALCLVEPVIRRETGIPSRVAKAHTHLLGV